MNFLSKEYLPDSKKRIAHLQKIVNGRPVVILAAGPSIQELENRIHELRHTDICYFGFNNFSIQEKHILKQIDRSFSVVMCSAREHLAKYITDITSFLDRDASNIFVSSFWRDTFELMGDDFSIERFLNQYDKQLIFFSLSIKKNVPNSHFPLHLILSNSLLVLIELAIIGKASKIVLFGADGYCKNTGESYYKNQCFGDSVREKSILDDTNKNFNPIAPIAIRNIYKTYDIDPVEILNCSEDSACTPFPKVSYDDAFDCLLGRKKFEDVMDLRIPKVTVISLCLDTGDLLKETIENISRQSYTNYEHIIIYREDDARIEGIKQKFPKTRWIPSENAGFIQAFKKAISMSRGDYIFYCGIGNGYLDQDWFNTCVEFLENDPDSSLIYGISQTMLPDGALGRIPDANFFHSPPEQGRYFIYDWFKRKILFQEENFCVRKNILEECFPFHIVFNNEKEAWCSFNCRFNILGYLPYFVPIVANYSRTQLNNVSNYINVYHKEIEQYQRQVTHGKTVHNYRAGAGKLLTGNFKPSTFFFLNVRRYIKAKSPKIILCILEKFLFFWKTYRWNAFSIAISRVWHRLTWHLINPKKKLR